MPELPEVETIRAQLEKRLSGKTITGVEVTGPAIIKTPDVEAFSKMVTGKTFKSVDRRAKYLIIDLSDELFLLAHLKMTGQLVIYDGEPAVDKHTHLVITLDSGESLVYRDIRKFGSFKMMRSGEKADLKEFKKLGPEPLGEKPDQKRLGERLASRKTTIKAVLLSQEVVAGLGNIYVDEVLYEAGISPKRAAHKLKKSEIGRLIDATGEVLRRSIKAGGTSMRDFVDTYGQPGRFQEQLKVYAQAGRACPRCGGTIERTVVAQRGTWYCPKCQK